MNRWVALLGVLAASAAFGAVGTIAALDGEAVRVSASGQRSALKEGSAIELGDKISVNKGALKLTLNDQSVIMLAQGSDLEVTEADFAGQERRSFVARLGLGVLWAKVTKAMAGSDAKFEVQTERAVAGVRGTVFQVEVVDASGGPETHVGVIEGKVAVEPRAPAPIAVAAAAPPARPAAAAAPADRTSSRAHGMAAPPAAPPPALAAAPSPVANLQMVGPGESVKVDGAGNATAGRLRQLPAMFDRFINARGPSQHERDRRERREDRREERRERRHNLR